MMKLVVVLAFIILAICSSRSNVQARRIGSSSNVVDQSDEEVVDRQLADATLTFKGKNGVPASAYPLGLCQGTCTGDYECSNNLKCYVTKTATTVPHCQGTSKAGYGYCIPSNSGSAPSKPSAPKPSAPKPSASKPSKPSAPKPSKPSAPKPSKPSAPKPSKPSAPKPSAPTAGARDPNQRFRLRLFWSKGYNWNNVTVEQFLCMQCDSTPCKQHDILRLQRCSSANIVVRFLNPTPAGGNSVQIKIVSTSLCLERTGVRAIKAENCRSGSYTKQFWNGDTAKDRFELHPNGDVFGCITADGKVKDPVYVQNYVAKRPMNVTKWTPF